MDKKDIRLISIVLACCALVWTTAAYAALPAACQQLSAAHYTQKVDNFLIIFDASETMKEAFEGMPKLEFAKKIVSCMNETIPDLPLSGGLRSFGRGYGLFSINATALLYGMTGYTKAGLSEGLAQITFPCGNTPLSQAINAGSNDLAAAQGPIAVIIISDGKATTDDPVAAAEDLKARYEGRICIYTITVGNDLGGLVTMKKIAGVTECGFMVTSARIATEEGMNDFIEKVFLKRKPVPVKAVEEPKVVEKIVLNAIRFDFDKSDIKPEYYPVLDEAIDILKKHPDKKVIIEGHTCWIGTEEYNMELSLRRAASVKNYLISNGLNADKLSIKGYGEERPIADNTTKQGRQANRRVEFKVLAND